MAIVAVISLMVIMVMGCTTVNGQSTNDEHDDELLTYVTLQAQLEQVKIRIPKLEQYMTSKLEQLQTMIAALSGSRLVG